MTITEEQYEHITEELDSHDFFRLGDFAAAANCSNMLQELDNLHGLSKQALDYRFSDDTQESLGTFLEEIGEIRSSVLKDVLSDALYAEDFEEE